MKTVFLMILIFVVGSIAFSAGVWAERLRIVPSVEVPGLERCPSSKPTSRSDHSQIRLEGAN